MSYFNEQQSGEIFQEFPLMLAHLSNSAWKKAFPTTANQFSDLKTKHARKKCPASVIGDEMLPRNKTDDSDKGR